jgi:hypothetical protein
MTQFKLPDDILSAALVGFEVQKNRIDAKIAELKQQLNGHSAPAATIEEVNPKKKRSAAVRRRMALAQKARWEKLKQKSEPAPAVAAKPKKRRMSAAGRKAISAASKKRWAAVKAAKKAKKPIAV